MIRTLVARLAGLAPRNETHDPVYAEELAWVLVLYWFILHRYFLLGGTGSRAWAASARSRQPGPRASSSSQA
jgi:hypothetical protein